MAKTQNMEHKNLAELAKHFKECLANIRALSAQHKRTVNEAERTIIRDNAATTTAEIRRVGKLLIYSGIMTAEDIGAALPKSVFRMIESAGNGKQKVVMKNRMDITPGHGMELQQAGVRDGRRFYTVIDKNIIENSAYLDQIIAGGVYIHHNPKPKTLFERKQNSLAGDIAPNLYNACNKNYLEKHAQWSKDKPDDGAILQRG